MVPFLRLPVSRPHRDGPSGPNHFFPVFSFFSEALVIGSQVGVCCLGGLDQVPRLAAYRGVTRIGALCLAAEVFDWRRFPKARPFMSFTGLVPGENSTGLSQRRGSITRAGNAHLRASSAKWPGPTSTAPTSGSASGSARRACRQRRWLVPGRHKSVCPSGSDNWLPTRTLAPWLLPPSPVSSPGSSGPRWWPRSEHRVLPVGQRAIGAASGRALHDAPEQRRSRSDPRRCCAHHRSS